MGSSQLKTFPFYYWLATPDFSVSKHIFYARLEFAGEYFEDHYRNCNLVSNKINTISLLDPYFVFWLETHITDMVLGRTIQCSNLTGNIAALFCILCCLLRQCNTSILNLCINEPHFHKPISSLGLVLELQGWS